MKKKPAGKSWSFRTACGVLTAQTFGQRVPKPAIVTVNDLKNKLDGLRSNCRVFVRFTGEDAKTYALGTVGEIRDALDKIAKYPGKSAVYIVCPSRKRAFNAWPLIWQGTVEQKYTFVAYVDPVRYGFNSRAEKSITIGPTTPLPEVDRQRGLDIDFDKFSKKLEFIPVRERVSSRTLSARYGVNWREVLNGYVIRVFRTKGKPQEYEIVKDLPSPDEYETLCRKHFTKTIEEMVEEAYGTMQELSDEMQEAFDNTPESLQSTAVAMAREETAETAGEVAGNKPEVPDPLQDLSIFRLPGKHVSSRSGRAYEAAQMLDTIRDFLESMPEAEKEWWDDDCDSFVDQIRDDGAAMEEIEFPGMFG